MNIHVFYSPLLTVESLSGAWLRFNKGSLDFDNGSRIVSATTTENTGRGMSISLLYCLDGDSTEVRIRDKETLVEEDITLADLFVRLYAPRRVIQ